MQMLPPIWQNKEIFKSRNLTQMNKIMIVGIHTIQLIASVKRVNLSHFLYLTKLLFATRTPTLQPQKHVNICSLLFAHDSVYILCIVSATRDQKKFVAQ